MGHSGDGCVLASTLFMYDLRKGDLFVLSWAGVRRVRPGSLSSELLMCGGGVRSILLLPLVARCLETDLAGTSWEQQKETLLRDRSSSTLHLFGAQTYATTATETSRLLQEQNK